MPPPPRMLVRPSPVTSHAKPKRPDTLFKSGFVPSSATPGSPRKNSPGGASLYWVVLMPCVVRVHVEDLEASDQIVPGTDGLVARAKIHRDAIVELEVVLEEVRLIEVSIVLVLARSVIEGAKPPEQEVGERISAAGRAWRTGVLAVRDEVPGPAEIVVDLGPLVLELEAELEPVASLDPVRLVVELEPVARESTPRGCRRS